MKGFTVVATLMLFPTLASAQNAPERGFYVGLHAGQSTFDITRFDVDDSGTAIAGVLGFRFNRYLAVEAGYADLGKGKYVAYVYPTNQVIGIVASPPEFDVSVRGPTAGIAAFLPLGRRFELHLGAGAFFSKLTEHAPLNASDSSVAAYSGLGLGWHIADSVTAAVDYARYSQVGSVPATGEGDVASMTAGLVYRF